MSTLELVATLRELNAIRHDAVAIPLAQAMYCVNCDAITSGQHCCKCTGRTYPVSSRLNKENK